MNEFAPINNVLQCSKGLWVQIRESSEFDSHTTTKYKYKIMSKECKTARNVVTSAAIILAILIVVMSMSSCGTTSYNGNPAYAGWGGGCQAAGK